MKNILLGAKYFALKNNSNAIGLEHFKLALQSLDLTSRELETFLKKEFVHIEIGTLSSLDETKIMQAQQASKIPYDTALKELIAKLEKEGFAVSQTHAKLHVTPQTSKDYFSMIRHIKAELKEEALGQEMAVEAICDGLMKAIYSAKSNKPYATFMFAGPMSPAKTHIAKQLALLHPEYALNHIRMSSYNTGSGSMQLFGTPSPYSGEKEGILTSFIEKNPKSLIIIEDIEMAEEESFVAFGKIINEGKCVDSFSSKEIDCSGIILVFITSSGKEIYAKHEFMQMAQNDQYLAERMILDAMARENQTRGSGNSRRGGSESKVLFEPSFMSALRKSRVVLFGKLGFKVCVELIKKALAEDVMDFEQKLGIKIIFENLDALAKLLILSSGPDFDIEATKDKAASTVLDILTDAAIAQDIQHKEISIDVNAAALNTIDEIVASENDMRLIQTLFRKSQTLNYKFSYDGKILFHSLSLDKVQRAKDFGEEGGFSIELPDISFNNIAGHHKVKERLKEAIAILKSKTLTHELGKHMPKGMLLYGPPGTGKTMLAKAFAKEADLPFIATTGNDMRDEEMMKKVFDKARDYAPSIVFIDEIDVFKHRTYGSGDSINLLLTLIDGFSTKEEERIFIVAATNLKDNIDEAILRSGRIDLHILVDYLDKDARAWFIDKMLKKEQFDPKINRERILMLTANFSGADLQKIESESILYANRKGVKLIDEAIVVEQINSLKHGEKIENDYIETMLERTAYHEAGHAIISKVLIPSQKIEQVTVTPRGDALGFVSYDTQSYQNHSKQWFQNRICVALAGRAVEMRQYKEEGIEGGASSDLSHANHLAYVAVAELGMDVRLFNISLKGYGEHKLYSQKIEEIIYDWIKEATVKTEKLVEQEWKSIERLAKKLLKDEVVEEEELNELLKNPR